MNYIFQRLNNYPCKKKVTGQKVQFQYLGTKSYFWDNFKDREKGFLIKKQCILVVHEKIWTWVQMFMLYSMLNVWFLICIWKLFLPGFSVIAGLKLFGILLLGGISGCRGEYYLVFFFFIFLGWSCWDKLDLCYLLWFRTC